MRRIAFRAWDSFGKVMWEDVTFDKSHIYVGWNDVEEKPDGTMPLWSTNVLMQYTGLKDKNGVEIYEGDILGLINPIIKGKQTEFGAVEVKFGEYSDEECEYGSSGIGWYVVGFHGYCRINGHKDTYKIGSGYESDWSLDRCLYWEVIGNVYENPELLEAK